MAKQRVDGGRKGLFNLNYNSNKTSNVLSGGNSIRVVERGRVSSAVLAGWEFCVRVGGGVFTI